MRPTLCLTCGPIGDPEFRATPPLNRMAKWQDNLAEFWGERPWAFRLAGSAILWTAIAIASAYFPETRGYTAMFVAIAVVLWIGNEYLPLAPTPFNVYNTVTSRDSAHATAARMLVRALFAILAVGALVCTAEQIGNVVIHRSTGHESIAPSPWSDTYVPWLTSYILAAPLLYFASMVVTASFVDPEIKFLQTRFQ